MQANYDFLCNNCVDNYEKKITTKKKTTDQLSHNFTWEIMKRGKEKKLNYGIIFFLNDLN